MKQHALPRVAVIIVSTSTLTSVLFETYIGLLYLENSVNLHVYTCNVMMTGGSNMLLY